MGVDNILNTAIVVFFIFVLGGSAIIWRIATRSAPSKPIGDPGGWIAKAERASVALTQISTDPIVEAAEKMEKLEATADALLDQVAERTWGPAGFHACAEHDTIPMPPLLAPTRETRLIPVVRPRRQKGRVAPSADRVAENCGEGPGDEGPPPEAA